MSINTLEFRTKATDALDKIVVQTSTTGIFADNNLREKFVGAKTVLIPTVDMQGLGDYDRDTGFAKGSVTVSNEPYVMGRDRGRSFNIDREDMDEVGIANLAGEIMGEFVRTKVVPEVDAYVLSKTAAMAQIRGHLLQVWDLDKPYAAFNTMVNTIKDAVGFTDEPLVAFIHSSMYAKFKTTTEITRQITVSDFSQGGVNFKVDSIDNVPLIPVSSSRMYTAYDFLSAGTGEEAGGFAPTSSAKGIYMIICPKKAVSLVKKTEKIRTFNPDQNLDMDAYKFDYRLYHDVFFKKSMRDTIWAWVAPSITVSSQPANATKTAGSISGNMSVTAAASDSSTLTYQWYQCDNSSKLNPVAMDGKTAATCAIPTTLTAGEYYFFVKVTAGGATTVDSSVATITVNAG